MYGMYGTFLAMADRAVEGMQGLSFHTTAAQHLPRPAWLTRRPSNYICCGVGLQHPASNRSIIDSAPRSSAERQPDESTPDAPLHRRSR